MKVVAKGKFPTPKEWGLEKYLVIEDEEKKYLLLNFINRREKIRSLTVEVVQKDENGKSLGKLTKQCKVENADISVVLDKIALSSKCADISARVVKADFESSHNFSSHINTFKRRRVSWAAGLALLMLLALSQLFVFFQLQSFVKNNDTFFYLDVEYGFIDGDKGKSSDIYVVGSRKNAKTIFIPNKILDHKVVAIDSEAFYENRSIVKLTIEAEVEIGIRLFENCGNLESLVLRGVTKVKYLSFANCPRLSTVELYGVSEIDSYAFTGSGIESLFIQDEEKDIKIGTGAFSYCANLTEVKIDQFVDFSFNQEFFRGSDNIEVLHLKNFNYIQKGLDKDSDKSILALFGLDSGDGAVLALKNLSIDYMDKIPDDFAQNLPLKTFKVKSMPSTQVGKNAFRNCVNLTLVDTPRSFTRIEDGAFYNTAITSFLGTNLVYIGDEAFFGCENLTEFKMESNRELSYLGAGAFKGCVSLQSISLPKKIDKILDDTFSECTALAEVKTESEILSIGKNAFFECVSLKSAPITKQTQSIDSRAFSGCKSLEQPVFPSSLTKVGNYAFQGCVLMEEVVLPDGLQEVGLGAFADCINIQAMTLPFVGNADEYTFFAFLFGATHPSMSFLVPQSIESITVTNTERIDDNAFLECASVKQIVLESEVTEIGNSAFYGCRGLSQFILPSSLAGIGDDAFGNCTKLFTLYNLSGLSITRNSLQNGGVGFFALNIFTSLDDSPTKIESEGFEFILDSEGQWYLANYFGEDTSLYLPQNLSFGGAEIKYKVVKYFMAYSPLLRSVFFQNSATAVEEFAFQSCPLLDTVKMDSTVTELGKGVFFDCISISEISIPFLEGSFLGFLFGADIPVNDLIPNSLRTITVLDGNIPTCAFSNLAFLVTVNLSGASTIGEYAFSDCTALKNLSLPDGLQKVGEFAFFNCLSLTSVTLPDTVTEIGFGAFQSTNLTEISLPFAGGSQTDNKFFAYIFGGSSYGNIEVVPNSLTTVTLTSTTEIAAYAFYNFYNLRTINMEKVQTIGQSAFIYCYSLQEVTFPPTLISIAREAFLYCNSLYKVTLQSQVAIAEFAFFGCELLYEVANLGGMDITLRSEENGHIAYYAIGVFASKVETLKEAEVNEIKFKYYGDNWAAVDYVGNAASLTLDSFVYEGKTISSYGIKMYAFSGKHSLQSLTIGYAVKYIDKGAFFDCINIEIVTFENSQITELRDAIFARCLSLKTVTLPAGLEKIASFAFQDCFSLCTIRLPSTLTDIYMNAFYNCIALVDVYNFSTLPIVKGSLEYGFVAQYALRVSTSELPPLTIVEKEGITYVQFEGSWYIVAINQPSYNLTIPSVLDFNGEEISSFILNESALVIKGFDTIYIPLSVTKILTESFVSYIQADAVILFEGTVEEWAMVTAGIAGSEISKLEVKFNWTA